MTRKYVTSRLKYLFLSVLGPLYSQQKIKKNKRKLYKLDVVENKREDENMVFK